MSYATRTLTLTCAAAIAITAAVSVSTAPAADDAATEYKLPEVLRFNRDIRPIFSGTCFACHGPDANTREKDLRLDVRADAIAKRDGFAPIVPGDPEESEAWLLITASNPKDQMPPSDFHTQLSPRDKAMVKKWIEQGAEYEKHWAFIPPKRPSAPKVRLADGTLPGPIDAFVLARLEAEGMKPAPGTDRRTLIRRVTLDLTGLPPTPEQVEAFVADTGADAYEKVVDRLLSSDAYAEHMTRHWLDAARYADTSGFQYDKIRHQWVWRDWVIHAFATNMPFDEFTILQTAGDLIPNATPQTRLATGFHRNHPITIEGGVIDEEYRTEYVMDRVVTTTTTWMGLTFTCARCHDHKYDPISMGDFYSFYAFFNNVPERGLNGFSPNAKIESPLKGGSPELETKIAAAQKSFDEAIAQAGGSLDAWEKKLTAQADAALKTVKPTAISAGGGTKLSRLEDGSILASGANPATQTYQVEFTVAGAPVSAIRLEALTDDSLVGKSTGRAHNGNFVLSEFEVHVADGPGKQFGKIKVVAAEASYEQNGYPISAAIDGKTAKGWAIDGNSRIAPSEAVFTLDRSVPVGARIRVRLVHNFGSAHAIGRFRLSIPVDGHAPVPSDIRKTLATAKGKRTTAQQSTLASTLVKRYGGADAKAAAAELAKLQSQRNAQKTATPATMILTEMPKPRQAYVLERGEYDKAIKDHPVHANVPVVFGGLPEGLPRNRLGLAKWLVAKDNPLTARVTVNRFWAQLFGTGLVKTVEDFGSQGEYPSHPELLDWLAVEFVESGWDVRHILKTIVTSATYRQSSRITPQSFAHDPENRLLARGPRFRVDAETVRDSALAVSGLLDTTLGGPSVYPYHPKGLWLEINNRPGYSRAYPHQTKPGQLYRRSMYSFWKRTVPPPSMATFDAPEREYCVVNRSRTNTPLQAFVMLHDPQFVEAARKLAERMIREGGDDANARLVRGFTICTARPPTERELKILQQTLSEQTERFNSNPSAAAKLLSVGQSPRDETIDATELAAYASVAHTLLNLSEFITKG